MGLNCCENWINEGLSCVGSFMRKLSMWFDLEECGWMFGRLSRHSRRVQLMRL